MKYIDEFRDEELAKRLLVDINKYKGKQINIMEVCGTHTMSIFRSGIKSLLPQNINLLSGPGCPVCVTPQGYIDTAINLSKEKGVILTTFGDLMRIPGEHGNLSRLKSEGGDVRIVYSPMDAIKIANENKENEIVFLSVGFETTTPIIAAAILEAKKEDINNISFLFSNKQVIRALEILADSEDLNIDGFLLPGHVTTIIGEEPYKFLGEKYNISGVIAGFEAIDILKGIGRLLNLIESNNPIIINEYKRAVRNNGNEIAIDYLNEVFETCNTNWRGFGEIKNSGFKIKSKYENFDSLKKFNVLMSNYSGYKECRCGDILRGKLKPTDCTLFKNGCSPEKPIGSCMVSSEGTCAAYYKYNIEDV